MVVLTIVAVLILGVVGWMGHIVWQIIRDGHDTTPDVGLSIFEPAWNRNTGALPIVDLEIGRHLAPPLPLPMAVSMVRPKPWMVGPRPAMQLALLLAEPGFGLDPEYEAFLLAEAVA